MKINHDNLTRWIIGAFGVILLLMGTSSMLRGNPNYGNFFGGVVFAPVAIIIGLLLIVIAIFRWNSMRDINAVRKRGRKK